MSKAAVPFLIVLLGAACVFTPPDQQAPAVVPLVETVTPVPAGFECQRTFEARELKEPYSGSRPRHTLSAGEWNAYLNLMGIQSLCIPVELGAAFVNADWDSAKMPATGRMVSLGFEGRYHGAGWSDIFLLYSTYDFSTGTEYDRFSSLEDRDALLSGASPNEIEINGIKGFARFTPSRWAYEGQPQIIYKTYGFPFENYYVAVVYNLGAFDGDTDLLVRQFQQGGYSADTAAVVEMFDFLATSLRFE